MSNGIFDPVRFLEDWEREDERIYGLYLEICVDNLALGKLRHSSPIESFGPSFAAFRDRALGEQSAVKMSLDEICKRKEAVDRTIIDLKLPLKFMSIDPSLMRKD